MVSATSLPRTACTRLWCRFIHGPPPNSGVMRGVSVRTAIRSARLPASSEPIWSSHPMARAPSIVAMRSASQASSAVASRRLSFAKRDAPFISSNMSKLLFSFSPSVPRPTAMPAVSRSVVRAAPLASFMLLTGLCDTAALLRASTRMSSSSSHTQCASSVRGSSRPSRSSACTGRQPWRSCIASTSCSASAMCVHRPVSNRVASSAARRCPAASV